ncbi:hypothetical protein AMK68_03260 [candidate division KD3-62 bacterium DG_56]|uniref:HTH crp-type domain-containing protein n=1 Tax=candidate division KD3-62 bacterium DG_56 TaxID=1704032 RepID=A0A0S7XMK9_9BACT|nr:MAG: hypothetical protein AMK68_03260 [candidate division KD3-62 bacterium DG_56]
MRLLNAQEVLRKSSLLDRLPANAAARLRDAAQVREYRRREVIYREGDLISGPAWVHWGLIRAYQASVNGREFTVLVAWPGEVSTPSLSGRPDWPTTTVAITPVVRATVPQAVLEEVCQRDPRVSIALVRILAAEAHERYRWCAWLMSVPLRERLPRILGRMAYELGTPADRGMLLDFPVVQDDLATIARVTRDEIGRTMREMLNEGIIERLPGRRLLIPDPSRLDV